MKKLLVLLSLTSFAFHIYASKPCEKDVTLLPQSYNQFLPEKFISTSRFETLNNIENFNSSQDIKATPRPMLRNKPNNLPAQDGGNVYGYLYYYTGSKLQQGFYKIDPSTEGKLLWIDFYTGWGMTMNGGWYRDGKICGLNLYRYMGGIMSYNYVELDFNTGDVVNFTPLDVDANDMTNFYITTAYRDLDDKVYGYGYADDGESMGFNCAPSTDFDASIQVKKVDFSEVCTSLCYNIQDDLFYGVNTAGKFVSVDHKGNQTPLFDVDIDDLGTTVSGIVYNPDQNNYTWNVYLSSTGKSYMYCIDPIGETATLIAPCNSSENYIFMVNTLDNVNDKAPAMPTIESVVFESLSTTGTITASLPEKTYDGSSLTGDIEWLLMVDGDIVDKGTATAGANITATAENISNDMHLISLVAVKDNKRSLPATVKKWIGADYPSTPQNVVLTENTLSWDAVTTSVNGGYVDYSSLKYIVYLNDEKVVETTSTSINIDFPKGKPYTSYTAYIVASCNGKDSEKGESNYINYGEPLTLNPSIHYRPEEYELKLFTTANVDGKKDSNGKDLTWRYTEDMAFPAFASGYDGDDWLFFPPIYFDDVDKAYAFVMEAGLVHDSDTRGTISVYIGKEPTVEAMTQVILPDHHCEHMRGDDIKEYFAVKEAGTYYIGIHAVTYSVSFHISDMDIARTDIDYNVPVAATNLNAVAADNGKLSATITFNMPEFTSNGDLIPETTDITATICSYPKTIGSDVRGELVDTKVVTGKPGSAQTVEIGTAQNNNFITVTCAINGKSGREAIITLYTGLVRPYVVQNLKAEITEDNMGMKLTWTPPVEGGEEGAIGEDFFYTIWYYNNGWEFGDNVGWNELEYTYVLPAGTEQQWIRLGIMAYNAAGQSDYITSVTEVIGTPYTLPIIENFPDYYETYEPIMIQRPTPEYEGTYWYVDDPGELLSPLFANKSGIAYIGFADEGLTNVKARLSLPKFSTKGLSDIKFSIDYFGGYNNSYAAQFHILADAYGIKVENVEDLPKGNKWLNHSFILPEKFNDKDWVEILIDADFDNDQQFAMFSAYSVSSSTGINNLSEENGKIYTTPGLLHLIGYKGKNLIVSDLSGRVVINNTALDEVNGYALSRGIYIVRVDNKSYKIVIK